MTVTTPAGTSVTTSADQFTYSTPCTPVVLTTNPASPSAAGQTVALSATAGSCPNPQYQFWTLAPNGSWQVLRSYGSVATANWTTTSLTPGNYYLAVWVKAGDSSAAYDGFAVVPYTLSSPPCSAVTLSENPVPGTVTHGTNVSLTTSGLTGCTSAEYQFWVYTPGSGWAILQAYSATSSATWTVPSSPTGSGYLVAVWVRATGSSAAYEAFQISNSYTVN